MADVRFVPAHSSDADALADPRAYLQRAVVTYARAIFVLFVIMSALMIAIFSLNAPPTEDFHRKPMTWLVFGGPPAVVGALWRFASRGKPSALALRIVEVVATAVPCGLLLTAPLTVPAETSDPASGTTGIVHLATFAACILVIRAAAVPCRPVTTFFVTLGCFSPVVPLAHLRWNSPHVMANLTVATTGAYTFLLVVVFIVFAATLVTRVVHRLETRAREVMQLGQYRLEEKIGEGGMGLVYRARHALLQRPTAIKLLPPDRVGDAAVARFEREVQHTSRLTHPNTVAIYDFGRTPDGVFYYAMEYLEGIDLEELVELDGPQPEARVIHVLAQAADALAEAHEAGLVHRDIKPANILLCRRGGVADTVKVLDFGLVKDVATPNDFSLTATATITGTPLYLAPEALADPDTIDARADLYALGAVAYWLLTGEQVFGGKTLVEVCSHHLHTRPMPPSKRGGVAVSAELEALVLACLEKAPDDRPASAAALRTALLACSSAGAWTRTEATAWWSQRGERATAVRKRRHDAA